MENGRTVVNRCGISGCGYFAVNGSSFCDVHQTAGAKTYIRPKTSQKVVDIFTKLVDSQDDKGIEKYGVTIDDAKDEEYEWNRMALEEAVDGMKYLAKENLRLTIENRTMKNQMKAIYGIVKP